MSRSLLLLGLAYGLILIGLATLKGGILALALLLVLYLGAGLFYAPGELDLEVVRSISPERASVGTPVSVRLSVTNRGSFLEEVLLEDQVPAGLERLEGEASVFAQLPPQAKLELSYTLRGRRGIYRFEGLRARAYDRLGISQREGLFPTLGQVFILPEIPRLKRVAIRPRQTRIYSGSIPARLGGSGIEFFGVREYQAGDPMRQINRRVSARHSETMFSNEFEQERAADVWLILDARRRSDIQSGQFSIFEHGVSATAALAQALLKDGNRVGLLVYGGFLDWTYPGYGKIQQELILRALARAWPGESMIFDQLENLPTRLLPLNSQLILISPLHYEDLPILVRFRARGYQVFGISPDPVAFERQALKDSQAGELGSRLALVERRLLLARLRQAGVQIFNWNVEIPFDRAMERSLSRLLPWFHSLGARL